MVYCGVFDWWSQISVHIWADLLYFIGGFGMFLVWQQQLRNVIEFGIMVSTVWDGFTWAGRVVIFPVAFLLMFILAVIFMLYEVTIACFKWLFIRRVPC
jgi:hypothetical protein